MPEVRPAGSHDVARHRAAAGGWRAASRGWKAGCRVRLFRGLPEDGMPMTRWIGCSMTLSNTRTAPAMATPISMAPGGTSRSRGVLRLAAKTGIGVAVAVVTGSVDRPDRRTAVSFLNPAGVLSRPQGQGTPRISTRRSPWRSMSVRFQANQSYRLTNAVLVYQDAQPQAGVCLGA
jgi:hypothetical protein